MIEPSDDLADVFRGAIVTARVGGLELSAADLACADAMLIALRAGDNLDAAQCELMNALVDRIDAVLAAWQRPN